MFTLIGLIQVICNAPPLRQMHLPHVGKNWELKKRAYLQKSIRKRIQTEVEIIFFFSTKNMMAKSANSQASKKEHINIRRISTIQNATAVELSQEWKASVLATLHIKRIISDSYQIRGIANPVKFYYLGWEKRRVLYFVSHSFQFSSWTIFCSSW